MLRTLKKKQVSYIKNCVCNLYSNTKNLKRSSWNFAPWEKEDKDNQSWQRERRQDLSPSLAKPWGGDTSLFPGTFLITWLTVDSGSSCLWLAVLRAEWQWPTWVLIFRMKCANPMMLSAWLGYVNIQTNKQEAQTRHVKGNEETRYEPSERTGSVFPNHAS